MPTIRRLIKTKTKRTDRYDAERRKIYQSQRWRVIRQLKIADSPLCEICKEKGIIKPAVDVHHIVSFMSTDDPCKRKALAYDYSNLKSLCKECHQYIHNGKGDMG